MKKDEIIDFFKEMLIEDADCPEDDAYNSGIEICINYIQDLETEERAKCEHPQHSQYKDNDGNEYCGVCYKCLNSDYIED